MAKSLWMAAGLMNHIDNSIQFDPLWWFGSIGLGGETLAQAPVRTAGTFSNLYVRVASNTATVTSVIVLRKNLASVTLTVSFGPDETGVKEDIVNTDACADTDEVDLMVTVPTEVGSNTLSIRVVGVVFTPDDATKTFVCSGCAVAASFSAASDTRYWKTMGDASNAAAEANEKCRIRVPTTASNFLLNVSANTRTTDTTFATRVNGADGAQLVTFGNAETGIKEDTSGTDVLAVGDDFNWRSTTGSGAGTLTLGNFAIGYTSTNRSWPMCAAASAGLAVSANASIFQGLGGLLTNAGALENNSKIRPRIEHMRLRELTAFASANTLDVSAVVAVRVDGATGNGSITYGVAETGLKTDTSGIDTLVKEGGVTEVNTGILVPAGTGSITVQSIEVWGEVLRRWILGPH